MKCAMLYSVLFPSAQQLKFLLDFLNHYLSSKNKSLWFIHINYMSISDDATHFLHVTNQTSSQWLLKHLEKKKQWDRLIKQTYMPNLLIPTDWCFQDSWSSIFHELLWCGWHWFAMRKGGLGIRDTWDVQNSQLLGFRSDKEETLSVVIFLYLSISKQEWTPLSTESYSLSCRV